MKTLRLAAWTLTALMALDLEAQPPLTLRQAVDRALGANPEAAVARADAAAARAGAAMTRTMLMPQLGFTEEISRGDDPVYAFGMRLKQRRFTQADFAVNALNRPNPIGNFSSRVSGQWMLFDSLKRERTMRQADYGRRAAEAGQKAVDQKIVMEVVQAYQAVLYAERQRLVAAHEVETAEALATAADDHVKAGLAVESDRMAAEVNLAARRQELIAAEGEVALGWAALSVAMGAPELATSPLAPIEAHNFAAQPLADEIALALKSRPDLDAMHHMQSAQGAAVGAARSDFGPRVAAYGNWEADRGSITSDGGHNWVAGAQISIDILPFTKRARLAQEQAGKARVDAQAASYQQQVRLQVSRAHIHHQTAAAAMKTAEAARTQATEGLRIVKNRYQAGLATITDLLRAEDAAREAETGYWRAVYANALAWAETKFSTGTLTPDAAEELQ